METSLPGTLRLRRPITGTPTAAATAATSCAPSARMPRAPPAVAARAIAAMCTGPRSGLPRGAWQETTNPSRSASSGIP